MVISPPILPKSLYFLISLDNQNKNDIKRMAQKEWHQKKILTSTLIMPSSFEAAPMV